MTVPDIAHHWTDWVSPVEPLAATGTTLQVRSKALLGVDWNEGIPRVAGAHYCTLVAPEYLKSVFLGQVPLP